jgi:hypothetical protein
LTDSGKACCAILGACLLAQGAASGAEAPQVRSYPAWEGYYRAGSPTEVMVDVVSPVAGDIEIRWSDTTEASTTVHRADAGQHLRAPIPVSAANATVDLAVRGDGLAPAESVIQLLLLDRPLVGVVADGRLDPAPWLAASGVVVLPVGVDALPRTREGYGPVDALLLDDRAWNALDPAQAQALRAYAGNCGWILLADGPPGDDPSAETVLHEIAGCGGAFLRHIDTPSRLGELLATHPDALPPYASLAQAASAPPRSWYTAVAFFVFYGLAILVVAFGSEAPISASGQRWPLALFAVPVLASLLMGAAWRGNEPERRLIVWAEKPSGAPVARYRALYQVYGQGKNAVELQVPAALGLPERLAAQRFEIRDDGAGRSLRVDAAALSRRAFGFSGAFADRALFELGRDPEGFFVAYHGATRSPPGILAIEGRCFAVPPLAHDERWRPDEDAPVLARDVLPPPLAHHTVTGLLIPLSLEQLGPMPSWDTGEGWLLVTPGAGESG